MNKFSKLMLTEPEIETYIKHWCEQNNISKEAINKTVKNDRIQYTINYSNNDVFKIDFIKCANGTITICPNVGKNIKLSKELAEFIYGNIKYFAKDSPYAKGFSMLISEPDFNTIIEILNESDFASLVGSSIQDKEGTAAYRLFKFKGKRGDSITIKYYKNTTRMQVQGKPLYLFNEIISLLGEFDSSRDSVVDTQLHYYNLDIDEKDINEEMETCLGTKLYNYLPSTLRIILSTTFILEKVDGYIGDASIILHPVNRVLEGLLKKIFTNIGLACEAKTQLGNFFDFDTNEPRLKKEYCLGFDQQTIEQLENMYNFYRKTRHPYAHASAYDVTTSVIAERKVAIDKTNEAIYKMKEYYKWFTER